MVGHELHLETGQKKTKNFKDINEKFCQHF